jgi:hypothetical protein
VRDFGLADEKRRPEANWSETLTMSINKCIYLGATSFVLFINLLSQQRKSQKNTYNFCCTLRVSHDIKIKAHATAFLL